MAEPPENQPQRFSKSEDPWRSLLAQVAQRQPAALTALYDGTNTLVYTVALGILKDPADAEEITLDVYAYVWRSAGLYDPSRGTATTWLIMLARSRAIERLRKRALNFQHGNQIQYLERLSNEGAGESAATQECHQRILIEAALRQLLEKDQELIRFAFFRGLSHPELALELGLPLGTVKSRIRSILSRLRDLIQ